MDASGAAARIKLNPESPTPVIYPFRGCIGALRLPLGAPHIQGYAVGGSAEHVGHVGRVACRPDRVGLEELILSWRTQQLGIVAMSKGSGSDVFQANGSPFAAAGKRLACPASRRTPIAQAGPRFVAPLSHARPPCVASRIVTSAVTPRLYNGRLTEVGAYSWSDNSCCAESASSGRRARVFGRSPQSSMSIGAEWHGF